MKIFLNGELVPEEEARISVFDHGLLYGDGIFEGIRVYGGRVFLLREHVERLLRSAVAIALDCPMSAEDLAEAVRETCRANRIRNGYVRLVVTRGMGTLGLNPYLCRSPQVIIIADNIQLYAPELYQQGLKIVTVGTVRNHPEAINPKIKSLNYLNNVLAKIEAINAGVMEAVMLNHQGFVAEATGDNIFAVHGREVVTPSLDAGCLQGITRDVVMRLSREAGMTVREEMMSRYDFYTADEVFLTGTAAEVIPVVEFDRRKIGDGSPGSVTKSLMASFRDFTLMEENGEAVG